MTDTKVSDRKQDQYKFVVYILSSKFVFKDLLAKLMLVFC